ncbi:P-loop containing nucleoside triphosphate hydrolase protein [Mycena rosella]|uniref:P-loop containing nucleoside triphosphate hydrolase protein n=1 Tax=Mycena rosella TaxID=1033263 RepID=A0AAD7CBS0_MYCRO|nr:P-loop containing nucleoside triphosphate hydrolase protein [Mycena rosella]
MSILDKIRGRQPSKSPEQPPLQPPGHVASSLGLRSIGVTLGLLSHSYLGSSLKLLLLGSLVETGRRLFRWLIERFGIRFSTTIRFTQGDPSYEWIVLFLTQENVWRRSREFVVSASNSRRKWAVRAATDATVKANAEYVPTYKTPQLFRWRGYWVEVKRNGNAAGGDVDAGPYAYPGPYGGEAGNIYITVYTLDMNVLSDLVEETRLRYLEVNRPNVVIHLSDSNNHYGPGQTWTTVKHKIRRPLSSIILPPGVIDTLMQDATEFLETENWYIEAGIPHRRGYLLHGPPGTGKTSTIYALAGALNLEIYSLSLASHSVDDGFLQRAASSIPKHGLLLIEDIDCAFASRDDEDGDDERGMPRILGTHGSTTRSKVTLSGLLNVIDGVGSEEGKLFFATTNYIDRLDPALLRPGRIDRKVAYGLIASPQAHALFLRFFPAARFPTEKGIDALAATFAAGVPPGEFSAAELQGFLQGYKTRPGEAAHGVRAWVDAELEERQARDRRRKERRQRQAAKPRFGLGLLPGEDEAIDQITTAPAVAAEGTG